MTSTSTQASCSSPPSSTTMTDAAASSATIPVAEVTSKDYYFDSYSHFGIHEEMLKDKIRTHAYRKAIVENSKLFKGKTVLDIGCGTGILCLFAAKAGAKQVIGIECANIATQAKQIVADNGFSNVITIIQGKVEEIELPVAKVDIIVSEWMGYFLIYESMLDTVIYARDKWLTPGGLLLPDKAKLMIAALEDGEYRENKIDYWNNVYGFDMSVIKSLALTEPLVDTANPRQIASNAATILDIDLSTVTKEQLDFTSAFRLTLSRNEFIHGLLAHFTVEFSVTAQKVIIATGPDAPYTHWKSTIFYFDRPIVGCKGEVINGTINVHRNAINHRDLDIAIGVQFAGKQDQRDDQKLFRLR